MTRRELVLRELKRVLKPGEQAQISVVHPIKWAAETKRDRNNEGKMSFLMGYDTYADPPLVYGDYLNATQITQKPQGYPEITYWSRPISEWLKIIWEAGFQLLAFEEPQPIPETQEIDPDYWVIHSKIPQFMIFVIRK